MIKFFRHIRRRLLSENKFSKYLLYAIGEIILVVIGILFALQINTWNEGRKSTAKEIHTLSQLNVDLKEDQEELRSILYWSKKSQQGLLAFTVKHLTPRIVLINQSKLYGNSLLSISSKVPSADS